MEPTTASPDRSTLVATSPVNPPGGLRISIVPHDHVDVVWEQVAPLLKRATDRSGGRYAIGDVYSLIAEDRCHLWIGFAPGMKIVGAATSVFNVYPGGKWLTAQFLGSDDMSECFDFLEVFERWAKDNDCVGIEFSGRSGWARVLKKHGYDEYHRFFQKDL